MADFQIFSLIKQYLKEKMGDQAIYFTLDHDMQKPCCVIELEEFWSNSIALNEGIKSKITFKTTCFSDDNLLSTQVSQSQQIVRLLDGLNLQLDDGTKAHVKFSQTRVNAPIQTAPQSVSQFFETVLRNN
ncbi:hypothetical protein [Candidatus Paracaedibacter symbiosus]|uniref:hypothetical protein n=1 Tax=Candidatus Paracaedibacter symbiosus TaxID=244582 RepID=UPI0005099272|nr:hypothetical protein [Candidatus Paracaedibacter symbiosus]